MPLPWKKPKSGRISRFVSDLQQSPKHGGSLVVETGFPTSLIDLFVKNRDRLKKNSSKRSNSKSQAQTPDHSHSHSNRPRRRVSSPPPPLPLQRRSSLPAKLDPASVTEDLPTRKIEESFVGGLASENRHDGDDADGGNGDNSGGGGCVLMVVVFKVFVVAVLALSTKKLAVGITLSAFALIFLEFAVARVFTLLNLCPGAHVRLHSLIGKLLGKRRRQEKLEESSSSSTNDGRRNNVSFEITETFEESRDCSEEKKSNTEESLTSDRMNKANPVAEEKEEELLTIRDVVFKKEKSKSAKLKSKIVKKIVPKKLRSYKKKRKMMKMMKKEEGGEEVEVEIVEEEGEEESVTEVSSLFSEDRVESEISEREEISSSPPLLESCEEIVEGEDEDDGSSKGDLMKAIVLIVIALAGLLSGKVVAIGLTLSSCLILRVVCSKSEIQTRL
ncbi:unnamed protein product [Microthlaspi erraticum]|uniref:Uncharacterized protein n=1 Tax=Microthlaspi erraticum TaxID=1685480 RepID=A0A6D2L4U5_9BRAS|nr:unnamed protein product [Microthlaspi erraticum]